MLRTFNLVDAHRVALSTITSRNISHAVFEDDIELSTSAEDVQNWIATRPEAEALPLGACGVNRFVGTHAIWYTPAGATKAARLLGSCPRINPKRSFSLSVNPDHALATAAHSPLREGDWRGLSKGCATPKRGQLHGVQANFSSKRYFCCGHFVQDRCLSETHMRLHVSECPQGTRTAAGAMRNASCEEDLASWENAPHHFAEFVLSRAIVSYFPPSKPGRGLSVWRDSSGTPPERICRPSRGRGAPVTPPWRRPTGCWSCLMSSR